MEILAYFDLHTIYLIVFSIALSIGSGAAVLSSLLFVKSIQNKEVSPDEYRMLYESRRVVRYSIVAYAFFGIGLFTLSAEAMLSIGIFYAAMTIGGIMVANAFFFEKYHLPRIKNDIKNPTKKKTVSNTLLLISETLSIVSWIFLVLHHAMYRFPIDYFAAMALYVAALIAVGVFFFVKTRPVVTDVGKKFLKKSLMAAIALFFILVGLSVGGVRVVSEPSGHEEHPSEENTTYTLEEVGRHGNIEDCWVAIDGAVFDVSPTAERYPDVYICGEDSTEEYRAIRAEGISDRVQSYQIGLLGFTIEDVESHNTKDACWIVIDDLVFDMTEESRLHPAAFNCGNDVSDNYHRNHGDGISEKQKSFQIGAVDDGVESIFSGNPTNSQETLNPYRELYVKEGSWDNNELIVVVEKTPEKLLFIDGKTHEEIGRIHDIGFQPHTSVYSPDAAFMYIIARNGWLTKIDLNTLEPVVSVRVGESSRGTALTDDGKYILIGNYIPGNVVVVDADSMKILKEIPTIGEIDGKEIESRVGAMVEDGDKVIVALKDLNSVWVIDTSKKDFPVIEKYWNIGNNETPLHDAFLSPGGRYYIVASMGSNTVWVMDTDTWEKVAEVPTGETPHTGPGASWGNKVYIPALGEGLITVIDMDTWEPVAHIETAGPGLFIRSFGEDPSYPYVWAETAFGEFHDEIYVIDARIDEIIKTIHPVVGESSWHPEFTNNGEFVYVVSQTANEVEVYDAWNFELVKRIEAETPSAVSNVGNRIEERGL
ncbi:hypothetical protein COB87_000100 [Candidatus Wolfebacteria bacterium]|nr:hypothetical protein [Candidatus Wolfebacteria bacterium]